MFPVGRARITLDSRLRAAKSDDLFGENVPMVGLLGGQTILEVKYDQPLPGWIKRLLSTVPGTLLSISKYALACGALY